MKYSFLFAGLLFCSFSTVAQPEIKSENKVQKFNKVKAGEILSFNYFIENKGNEPLIISDVIVACGCTKPEIPKKPVLPGEKINMAVTFDTKGKYGYQDRTLEIISNAKNSPYILRFKGNVEKVSNE
jgi:hypothetical protein